MFQVESDAKVLAASYLGHWNEDWYLFICMRHPKCFSRRHHKCLPGFHTDRWETEIHIFYADGYDPTKDRVPLSSHVEIQILVDKSLRCVNISLLEDLYVICRFI